MRAEAEDSSSVRVAWSAPPAELQNGHIAYYKLYYVEASRPDKEAVEMMLKTPLPGSGATEFVLEEWSAASAQSSSGKVREGRIPPNSFIRGLEIKLLL